MKYYHPDCPYLHPTEAQQNLFYQMYMFKPFHNCKRYMTTVKHRGHDQKLVRTLKCDIDFTKVKKPRLTRKVKIHSL